jgi:hypothetical protein
MRIARRSTRGGTLEVILGLRAAFGIWNLGIGVGVDALCFYIVVVDNLDIWLNPSAVS